MRTETRALAFLESIVVLIMGSSCTLAVSGAAGFPGEHQQTVGMAVAAGKDQRIERQELAESVHALALPASIGMAVAAGKDQRIERQELAESVHALAVPGSIGMAVAAGKDQRIERQELGQRAPTLPS